MKSNFLFGLSQRDYDKIYETIAHTQGVEQAIIYGSRAKGNFKAGSDIDLTISGKMTWVEFHQLESQLDDLMLPYQFDLSLLANIDNKKLVDHINRAGKIFYRRNEVYGEKG